MVRDFLERILDTIGDHFKQKFRNCYYDLDTEMEFKQFTHYHKTLLPISPKDAERIVKIREYMFIIKAESEKIKNEVSRKLFEDLNLESLYEWSSSKSKQWHILLT